MRILHVGQKDASDAGGSLRVAEALVREQRSAGLDARLLFLYGAPGGISAEFEPNTTNLRLESSRQMVQGVLKLARAIRKIDPDIIHSHDGIMWPRIAYFKAGVPVVTHGHLPPETSGGLKQRLGWPLVRKTTRRVIGISSHTANQWVEAGFPAERVEVIVNGVDFNRFTMLDADEKAGPRHELGLPENKRVVVWVGRLHREMKGTDRVEKIAAILPESAVLVVVGNGAEFAGMNERCKDSIASGRMIMAGAASQPELYYKAADAFLFTSRYEPFGLVLLEAVACGLPIFYFPVTGGGGATELLETYGTRPLSDDVTRDQLKEGLDSLDDGRSRSILLREKASGYSWSILSKQVVSLYESVLQEGRH